ncbi:MAG: 50S ribosomal protein L4 [Ruminococcus sp.]|uniref:50S ribosomal protein L4 n=1 Tax=Ruminococcus sp. TaxID=41978 RepID=UPI00292EB124|nr:50S ribosomal protein L4 [uncultured Ruminococcus sp.]MBQ1898803.1 50S ribosomal protein L4 [Ruminococcus sp.]MBQ6412490.1 50S ribosomal protein L4 [Ruminococcus sp.]
MPNVQVLDMQGKKVSTVDLADSIFGIEPNAAVMHMMVVSYLANQRQGTQSALTRSEVSGGGRKPWRQKGTGRARQGSTRAPQWYHGGVVFAPKPRDYRFSVNKKVKRLAMKSALSAKAQAEEIIVIDKIAFDEIKTAKAAAMLSAVGSERKALIVLPEIDEKAIKSYRNIAGVKTAQVNELNVYDILNADKLIIAKDALTKIEEVYA